MTERIFTSVGQSRFINGRHFGTSFEDGKLASCRIDGKEVNAGEFQAALEREGFALKNGVITMRGLAR